MYYTDRGQFIGQFTGQRLARLDDEYTYFFQPQRGFLQIPKRLSKPAASPIVELTAKRPHHAEAVDPTKNAARAKKPKPSVSPVRGTGS